MKSTAVWQRARKRKKEKKGFLAVGGHYPSPSRAPNSCRHSPGGAICFNHSRRQIFLKLSSSAPSAANEKTKSASRQAVPRFTGHKASRTWEDGREKGRGGGKGRMEACVGGGGVCVCVIVRTRGRDSTFPPCWFLHQLFFAVSGRWKVAAPQPATVGLWESVSLT